MDDLDSLAVNFIQLPPRALALALCNAAYLAWAEDPERNYAESYELAQRAVALDARPAQDKQGGDDHLRPRLVYRRVHRQ